MVAAIPGKLYIMEGYSKASGEIPSNLRDGFFRMDFYGDAFGKLQTSVSGRVYGSSQWMKLRVIAMAPEAATHLTISFERENPDREYWIDKIVVYESDEKLGDDFPTILYVKPTMPNMTLFPNSIY